MSDNNSRIDADFGQMIGLLMEDVMRCRHQLEDAKTSEDQEFWKRTYTRSVFAQIEGFTEYFRTQALIAETNKLSLAITAGDRIALHSGLLSVLAGEAFLITDSGEIKSQNLRVPFLPNLLFCFNRFAEAHGVEVRVEKGPQWERIKSAVRVRDGLMHPKSPKSLEISSKEIEDVEFTLKWFYQNLHAILKSKSPPDPEIREFPSDLFSLKLKNF
jgi:hypothetical protein